MRLVLEAERLLHDDLCEVKEGVGGLGDQGGEPCDKCTATSTSQPLFPAYVARTHILHMHTQTDLAVGLPQTLHHEEEFSICGLGCLLRLLQQLAVLLYKWMCVCVGDAYVSGMCVFLCDREEKELRSRKLQLKEKERESVCLCEWVDVWFGW